MNALRWVYRRIGQMTCFAIAPFAMMAGASDYSDGSSIAGAIAGSAFLFAGVALRAINIWKERGY